MESRVAIIGIIVENMEATERLNAILHEYAPYVIGRMGIPYRENYTYQVTPFDPISVSYDKIIRDFKEAERLLTAHGQYFDRTDENAGGFVKDRVIHMNLYAVQALLARVYWEKGDLETAKN